MLKEKMVFNPAAAARHMGPPNRNRRAVPPSSTPSALAAPRAGFFLEILSLKSCFGNGAQKRAYDGGVFRFSPWGCTTGPGASPEALSSAEQLLAAQPSLRAPVPAAVRSRPGSGGRPLPGALVTDIPGAPPDASPGLPDG